MEIARKQATQRGGPDRFIGDAWIDMIASTGHLRVAVVRFAPGARNAWHSHALGQTLHVTEGVGLTQSRGGEIVEIHAGDTVNAAPNEWHWHGAAPDHFMTHLAIFEAPGDGTPESQWGDHVGDEEYGAARS
jgi:quercetin dioxygenase-like cupin family protein